MKALKFFCLVLMASAFLVGCKKKGGDNGGDNGGDTPAGINFEALAKESCDCMTGLAEVMEKMEAAGDNTDALTALMAEMAPKMTEMEGCMTKVQAKYPDVDGNEENETKAEAALKEHCPAYSKMAEMGNNG